MESEEKLSLTNIKEGAAVEMFDLALEKVLANIQDINTTLAPREITLKVVLTPSEHRDYVNIVLSCPKKLAIQDSIKTTANLTLDSKGRAIAHERRTRQLPLVAGNVSKLEE